MPHKKTKPVVKKHEKENKKATQKADPWFVAILVIILVVDLGIYVYQAETSFAEYSQVEVNQSATLTEMIYATGTPTISSVTIPIPTPTVTIGSHIYKVTIADTRALRDQGLSGTKKLTLDQGMFFIFQEPDMYGFWMKGMNFPLDIIWFDSHFKVIHIEKNLTPASYPTTFYPESPALYVLEVNAGEVARNGIKIGDSAVFTR